MKIRHIFFSLLFLSFTISSFAQLSGKFTDARDSRVYSTIKIGTQTWMAENLQAEKYRNGDSIPNVTVNTKWSELKSGAWCYYKNFDENGKIYGKLYNFYAVRDPRGIAPEGWHIPSAAEWQKLLDFLGGSIEAGGKLKEAGTSHWASPNTGATNESFFSSLPGGCCYGGMEQFYDLGKIGYWWTSTPGDGSDAAHRIMYNHNNSVASYNGNMRVGYSVRCVKD
jgi:uncharacterized protein (TIGR02145 family)